jgi:hypothetical protein
MKKNDSLQNSKFRVIVDFTGVISLKEIKATITFSKHALIIRLWPDQNKKIENFNKDLIKNIMFPLFFCEREESYQINYTLIQELKLVDRNFPMDRNNQTNMKILPDKEDNNFQLNFEIYNPCQSNSIIFKIYEFQSLGVFFTKSLKNEDIKKIEVGLKYLIENEVKHMLEQYMTLFNLFKDGLRHSKWFDLVKQALNFAKLYYESNLSAVKSLDKLKNSIREKIFSKNSNDNEIFMYSPSMYEENAKGENKYTSFDIVSSDIKRKSMVLINQTVTLFFQIASVENFKLDLKKVDKEKITRQLKNLNISERPRSQDPNIRNVRENLSNKIRNFRKNHLGREGGEMNKPKNSANLKIYEQDPIKNITYETQDSSTDINRKKSFNHNNDINTDSTTNSQKDSNSLKDEICTPKFSIDECENDSWNKTTFQKDKEEDVKNKINKIRDHKSNDILCNKTNTCKTISNNISCSGKGTTNINFNNTPNNNLETNIHNNYPLLYKEQFNNPPEIFRNTKTRPCDIKDRDEDSKDMKYAKCFDLGSINNYNNFNINLEENSFNFDNLSFSVIKKKIDKAKANHAFLPSNDFQNIIMNTVEVVHRKFFELIFENHFEKLFHYEKDMNNLIKLESIYNQFIYLRGLKLILFNEKNKIFFSNIFFDN